MKSVTGQNTIMYLINSDLCKTENDLKTILKAERLKLTQQPQIVNDVRNLNNEFENR
jgi:guanylate kinase